MLTSKQASLFKLLEISPEREAELRARHKLGIELGSPKSFTAWLTKCLHAKWRRDNERSRPMYVGD